MIDLEKLYRQRTIFGLFAQLLDYPNLSKLDVTRLEESVHSSNPFKQHIYLFLNEMKTYDLDDVEELYTHTFDFQKKCTLYMTYFKYEDAKERGQMLAKLKVMYEMYGLEMPVHELSDYLPLICEFIYAAEWKEDPRTPTSFSILFGVLEDGTWHLMNGLKEMNSPYYHLIFALRGILKSCVQQEEAAHEHA